ncbi:hypothetical protein SAMN04490220_1182 [Rhodococcus jostii]|uniref:Uncharacterized protein n=1 Tax=Rhodococcus jostii TaxID=132919 RepID=A0A1H4R1H4_RHOJO|nr:hypothetical protein SAMN04490220_1182 [Rhodococcus jostii]
MSTMTLANIGPTVSEPDGCEVWLWYEFGLFVADSEGILADALTPQAVVLLTLVNTDRLGSPPPLPASVRGWTPLPVPPPATRAKQRSPPEHGGERGQGKFLNRRFRSTLFGQMPRVPHRNRRFERPFAEGRTGGTGPCQGAVLYGAMRLGGWEPLTPGGVGGFSRSARSMAAGETHLIG